MIYERRALQRRLAELRGVIDGELVDGLAQRLNRAGKDRVAAMWETVVLHALSKCGTLENEVALESGRRPDIKLAMTDLKITADVTAVSDEGLDNANPYHELGELVGRAKDKLGLPIGSLDIRIRSRHEKTQRGTKTVADLPGVTPHVLRHTLGSTAASAGEALLMVGSLFGHSNARSTQIYAHIAYDPARLAADRVTAPIAAALIGGGNSAE